VQNSIKLAIVKFIGHLAIIVVDGIAHVYEKPETNSLESSPLSLTIPDKILLIKYS
jgi:hypothetical protein